MCIRPTFLLYFLKLEITGEFSSLDPYKLLRWTSVYLRLNSLNSYVTCDMGSWAKSEFPFLSSLLKRVSSGATAKIPEMLRARVCS